jgi:uncharacterized protein (TIGR03435 family)
MSRWMAVIIALCASAGLTGLGATSDDSFDLGIVQEVLADGGSWSVNDLIRLAYDDYGIVHASMIVDAPHWASTERYALRLRGSGGIGPAVRPTQLEAGLLQTLLSSRFDLAFRREIRSMSVYALVPAREDKKLGPRITASYCVTPTLRFDPRRSRQCTAFHYAGHNLIENVSMEEFADALSRLPYFDRLIRDRTGLAELYHLQLPWPGLDPWEHHAHSHEEARDFMASRISQAMRTQLGLTLTPTVADVATFVVTRLRRPSLAATTHEYAPDVAP